MLRAIGWVGLILAALMAPLVAAPAWAQTQVGDYLLQGEVVAGFRFLPSEPSKSEPPTNEPVNASVAARPVAARRECLITCPLARRWGAG